MNAKPSILVLEDYADDVELLVAQLRRDGLDPRITHVERGDAYELRLKQESFDLIISDYSFPGYDGLTALKAARSIRPEVPFLFFSGTLDENIALDALRNGAGDYVLKQHPRRLSAAVRRLLAEGEAARARTRMQERVQAQAQLLDLASDAIAVLDLEGIVTFWNDRAERLYGRARSAAIGIPLSDALDLDPSAFVQARDATLKSGSWAGEFTTFSRAEECVHLQSRWTLVRDRSGNPSQILTINTDITQQKRFELQFLQAQRVESLGQLAGGLAHDLKNILGPIMMGCEALGMEIPAGSQSRDWLRLIETHAKRGAQLLDQMLGFAQGNRAEFVQLDLTVLLRDVCSMLHETFPRKIQVSSSVAEDLPLIHADETQIYQVLINLCINARDAMPNGGRLMIRASTAPGPERPSDGSDPAPCVLIEVVDTGTGISAEVREKMFEPFFTTKERGKNNGLGLATVVVIMKRHKGIIEVQSSPGAGTTFRLRFPSLHAPEQAAVDSKSQLIRFGL